MKSLVDLLDSYVDEYRELVDSNTSNSHETIRKSLRLNKEEDWAFICTAMDVVGSASLAITNFLSFGLDGPTKYDDAGEKYLRLYGALNATYIQQQAVLTLFKLNQVSNPDKAKEKIECLRVRDVRHKLGAHSNEYLNRDANKKESYVLTRLTLAGFNCEFLNNETSEHTMVDLKSDIEEHLKLMVELLDETYEKAIGTFHKGNQKKQHEFKDKLKDLRIEKEGGLVIPLKPDGRKLIITMKRIEFVNSGCGQ